MREKSRVSLRMKISGYPELYRKNIIESALAASDKKVLEDRFGLKPLYRSHDWKKSQVIRYALKKKKRYYLGNFPNM